MNQDQFIARRQPFWQQLAALLDAAQRTGVRRLESERVRDLGRLYRQAASDLAYARTYFPGSTTGQYLNQLVTRAHSLVYAEEPQRWRNLLRFLGQDLPRAVRQHWRPLLLAIACMAAGAIIGFFAVLHDPNLAEALVPASVLQHTGQTPDHTFPVTERALIGTQILLNNVWVSVLSFGLGFTLGIGTAVVLFTNGVMLGSLFAVFFSKGNSYPFWALIVPHGALELTAIFLCGAAGFVLGWPIIAPGDLTRTQALAHGARAAIKLVAGAIPLLIIAATIEGFVTPMTSLPESGKYAVGLVTGVLAWTWFVRGGRQRPKGLEHQDRLTQIQP